MGSLLSYLTSSQQGEETSLLELLNAETLPWDRIRRRLGSDPEEAAAFAHGIDSSPLQRALEHPGMPLKVAQAFLDAYEEAVYYSNSQGDSVLHTAVQNQEDVCIVEKLLRVSDAEAVTLVSRQSRCLALHHVRSSPQIARLLLRVYPEAILAKDKDGRLPLHHACSSQRISEEADEQEDANQEANNNNQQQHDNNNDDDAHANNDVPVLPPAHPEVIEVLLDAAKEHGLADGGVLSKDDGGHTPLHLLCEDLTRTLQQQGANDEEEEEKDEGTFRLWESLTLLVQAATCSQAEEDSFRMVHAVIALGCPPAIVKHALSLYPHQVYERDANGRTPLMMAAVSIPQTPPPVLCLLLQDYPAAARMTDDDGRLPIDILSAKHFHDERLWELMVKAEPRAVDTRDLRDKMFPFMTAAIYSDNVNTIYSLLRAKPHVLQYFQLE